MIIHCINQSINDKHHTFQQEQQHRQGWLGYWKRRYKYWEDGSRIAIGSMSKLTPTGYIMLPADISFPQHDFPSQRLLLLSRRLYLLVCQSPPPFLPVHDHPKFHDQVDVCRYSIYRYWGLGVRPSMYVAKVAV